MIVSVKNLSYFLDDTRVVLHDEHGREVAEVSGNTIPEKILLAEKITALSKIVSAWNDIDTMLSQLNNAMSEIRYYGDQACCSIDDIREAFGKVLK